MNSNNEPYVYQVAVKDIHKTDKRPCGLPKIPTLKLNISIEGCEGDFNEYRTKHKHSTNDRAVSLITNQLLDCFADEGWPVLPGDLGEI